MNSSEYSVTTIVNPHRNKQPHIIKTHQLTNKKFGIIGFIINICPCATFDENCYSSGSCGEREVYDNYVTFRILCHQVRLVNCCIYKKNLETRVMM